jgi:Mg2+ and Co2+ transporter CorA
MAASVASVDLYFESQGNRSPCGQSPEFYRQRLLTDSRRVFSDNEGNVHILSWPTEATEIDLSVDIESSASLKSFLQGISTQRRHFVYAIRQKHTWDNLSITRDLLLSLLTLNDVFLPFLDCVHAFGFRMNDDDEVWEGYQKSCTWDSFEKHQRLIACELSYTYSYVTTNGRSEGPTWSLRQTAVYHKMNVQTGCSIWILIQPSQPSWMRFKKLVPLTGTSGAMDAHLIFLNEATVGWKGFLGHLRPAFAELDEKASFARVGQKRNDDYSVSVADGQRLHKFRQKLSRSLIVLDGTKEVISGFGSHLRRVEPAHTAYRSHPHVHDNLEELLSSVRYYRSVIQSLVESSAGTAALLKQIPDYRLMEELGQSSRSLEASMMILRSIAAATQDKNENLLRLATQSRKDSIRVRTLTLITIFYLPATLLATIFSSNLVDTQPLNEGSQPTKLVITSQFWIYVVVAVVATLLTMTVPFALEKREKSALGR